MSVFGHCGTAIRWNENFPTSEISVVGGKQNTGINSKPAENQFPGVQVLEQKIQRRLEKTRVPGFEYKIIVALRQEFAGDGGSAHAAFFATLYQVFEIRLPLPKIIINIQTWNPTLFCLEFKLRYIPGHGQCVFNESLPFLKFQIINHVDQKEYRGRVMKYACLIHPVNISCLYLRSCATAHIKNLRQVCRFAPRSVMEDKDFLGLYRLCLAATTHPTEIARC